MTINKKSNVITISCDNLKEYDIVCKSLSGYYRYDTCCWKSYKVIIVHIYNEKYADFLNTLCCRCVAYA